MVKVGISKLIGLVLIASISSVPHTASAVPAPARRNGKAFQPLPAKNVKTPSVAAARVKPPPRPTLRKPMQQTNAVQPNWTRVVRATDSALGITVAETAALVVDSQYLVVPWTFISEVWLNRPGSRIVVEGLSQEVALIDVDVASNLALLKSNETVLPSFFRAEIRREDLRPEEPLTFLSGRGWLLSGGKYFASKSDGILTRYQIGSAPTNMSSGDGFGIQFVFDSAGRLAAVNHANTRSGNAEGSWSVPARSVLELIHHQDGPKPASLTVGGQRRTQLYSLQGQWARNLLLTGVPLEGSATGQIFDCKTRLASISDRELAAGVKSVRALDCVGKFQVPIVQGYNVGYVIQTGDASLTSSDLTLGAEVSQTLSGNLLTDLNKSAALVNLLTVPECRENNVENGAGANLRVKFCTSALKFEPGLADTYISVTSVDANAQMHYVAARLRGFDQESSRKVLRALVEKIRTRR
jgi:hypothetical protein